MIPQDRVPIGDALEVERKIRREAGQTEKVSLRTDRAIPLHITALWGDMSQESTELALQGCMKLTSMFLGL